jgi:hypothetical protein
MFSNFKEQFRGVNYNIFFYKLTEIKSPLKNILHPYPFALVT